ncbi:MAG: 4Fe-4S dicluster domain-containing protein [candidate division Zixibacteria bacterium]|nr:4Fe-4S dicluster domain-containing protein [candidate division Zixibacteria bacterium]
MLGILIDTTKCTGCEKCVMACINDHRLDSLKAETDRAVTRDGLSANRWATIMKVDDGRFARKSCMHCIEPSCVSACLVGGITKEPDGPVVYDPDKCIGCRYCMLACPFHVPRYEWDRTVPFMRKCDMCFEKLKLGQPPACVAACPNQVMQVGKREDLLKTAHRLIDGSNSGYLPHVWGESEFGGTSVLYISDVDLAALGWPETTLEPIPSLTEPLISKTPFIGLGVAASILSINWIIRRREKLAGEQSPEKPVENESGEKRGRDE